jgi:hypothetical protein
MTEPTDTTPDPDLHPVHVEMDVFGTGTLTVDGHDLTKMIAAGGVTIQGGNGRGEPTKVYVELLAGATYDGPAEVHIIQGAHTVEFLQSVNAETLATAALLAGFNRNPIDVALELLIEMAQAIATGDTVE